MTKIALSFDDGRKDNYIVAKEILEPLNIPASFNITTGYIQKTIKEEDKPSAHEPMSLEEVKDLAKNDLFEIAGHGYTHDNEQENLISGVKKLRDILNLKENQMGIASPHSEFDISRIEKFKKECQKNNISYLRISHRFEKNYLIRKIIRKINRKLNIPFLYYYVYKDTDIKQSDKFLLYSVPIIKDNKLSEIKYLIEKAIKNDKSYILMLHSVLKPDESYYSDLFTWDYNDFYELCKYLKKLEKDNKIKITKVIDINRE